MIRFLSGTVGEPPWRGTCQLEYDGRTFILSGWLDKEGSWLYIEVSENERVLGRFSVDRQGGTLLTSLQEQGVPVREFGMIGELIHRWHMEMRLIYALGLWNYSNENEARTLILSGNFEFFYRRDECQQSQKNSAA